MNIALLTAAGSATRMQQHIPKQFLPVDNKPVIIHTMEHFQVHPEIDAIVLVTRDEWRAMVEAFAAQFGVTKLCRIVTGGATGQESILNGLHAIQETFGEEDTVVLVHDGNRPLVSEDIITDSLATYRAHGCAVAVVPCTEVVFETAAAGDDHGIRTTPRERLRRTQTPHTYALKDLLWAHSEAQRRGLTATAATPSLMAELGRETYFSRGSEENFKITTVFDLKLMEALLHTEYQSWLRR